MNARQLEVFRAIMRSGSLTAAAAALNVSQPAVSKLLRHFEDQLGFRLFERDSGRLSPTAEAHLLIRDADRIFREIEVLKELAERIRKNELGLLRVGASAPPTFALLPRAIERFRRRHPGIRLEVQTLSAEAVGEGILVGDLDLGVTMAASSEPHLRCLPLGAAEIVVVMPAGSGLAAREAVGPTDLAGEALISYGSRPPIGRALDQTFAEAGCVREVAIEITLSIAAAPLVQRGLGVALVDGLVAWERFPGLAVRPFRPAVDMGIVLVSSAQRPETRFAKEFGRDLAAAVADRAG